MGLVIRIIASPEGEPVTSWSVSFPDEGGSIGRVTGSTFQLVDRQRIVSGTHAIISRDHCGYRITDVSTNGLYVNGSKSPLGRDRQIPLNDGDILDIGGYRLQVSCFSPDQGTHHESVSNGLMGADNALSQIDSCDAALKSPQGNRPNTNGGHRPQSGEGGLGYGHRDSGSFSLEPDPFAEFESDLHSLSENDMTEVRADELMSNMNIDQGASAQSLPQFSEGDPLMFGGKQTQTMKRTIPADSEMSFMLSQMQWFEQRNRAREMDLYDCLEAAFCRVIEELNPDQLMTVFDGYSSRGVMGKWRPGRKAYYWRMYCHYFHKSVSNRDLLLKFRGCFDELYQHQCWRGKSQ